MDILVTGGGGQVGLELQRVPLPPGVRIVAPSRSELDLSQPTTIRAAISSRPWGAVINAAAFTAVDAAEDAVEAAWTINAVGPAMLAADTAKAGIPLVHVSTDYVFSGEKDGFYVEEDAVAPLGVYGASKEGGEQAVRTGNPRHVIARTAWVISAHRSNFAKTMLRLGAERPVLRVVEDQHGCPTSAKDLAEALIKIALRIASDRSAPTGSYHIVNGGETTWCGLARETFRVSQALGGDSPDVQAIATAEYPTRARRPANSRLATNKVARDFGIRLRPWQGAIADIVRELRETGGIIPGMR